MASLLKLPRLSRHSGLPEILNQQSPLFFVVQQGLLILEEEGFLPKLHLSPKFIPFISFWCVKEWETLPIFFLTILERVPFTFKAFWFYFFRVLGPYPYFFCAIFPCYAIFSASIIIVGSSCDPITRLFSFSSSLSPFIADAISFLLLATFPSLAFSLMPSMNIKNYIDFAQYFLYFGLVSPIIPLVIVFDCWESLRLVHARSLQFFAPFIFLNSNPLFDKIFSLWTDFEFEGLIKNTDIFKKTFKPENLFSSLEIKVAKRKQFASGINSSLEILDVSEFGQQFYHTLICALWGYIFNKHFLPDFLFWFRWIIMYVPGIPNGLTVKEFPPIMGVIVIGSSTK